LHHLFGELEAFVHAYGAVAVTIVLFLESLGLPLPGESLLVFSGIEASRGVLSPTALAVAAWAGSVLGDNTGYLVGRLVGRRLILRHGARIGLTEARYARVEAVMDRYGPIAVTFARFVNVLRQLNGLVAGTAGMHWARFFACNALGAALWVAVWALGAYFFGTAIEARLGGFAHAVAALGPAKLAALAAAAMLVGLAALLVMRRRR
jgi:membrane protein DedA with SNARE-associated domain